MTYEQIVEMADRYCRTSTYRYSLSVPSCHGTELRIFPFHVRLKFGRAPAQMHPDRAFCVNLSRHAPY